MQIRRRDAGIAAVTLLVAMGCAKAATQAPPPAPTPAVTAPAPAARPQQPAPNTDSIQAINDKYIAQVSAQIVGKENLPAEQVFKDIQLLQGTPASRLLAIMNQGYSRALGVTCTKCHNPTDFASNEKGSKKEARGMIRMVNMINDGNKNIPEFAGDAPIVNCTVCHRGSTRPVRNLPGQGGGRPGGAPPVRTGD